MIDNMDMAECHKQLAKVRSALLCVDEAEPSFPWTGHKIIQAHACIVQAMSLISEAEMIAARERAGGF